MRFLSGSGMFSGNNFLTEPTVLVLTDQGMVEDLLPAGSIEENRIERYDGMLTPGFINTHCHLELSHLQGAIPQHTGIVDFGMAVIRNRNTLPAEIQLERMQQADKAMQQQGIVAVGDISNTALSAPVKQQSSLYYHTFVELIALNPERAGLVFEAGKEVLEQFQHSGLAASLAPHAPYSCSPELIKMISDQCHQANQPTSMHNQESIAENAFFMHKTGDYLRLYETLHLPLAYFEASGKSSLQTVLPAFHKAVHTLLVHNTFTDKAGAAFAQHSHPHLFWCLCPNANLYIENTLPDTALLSAANCIFTLGTDSLASNFSLSIMDEINCLLMHKTDLSLEVLLKAATSHGARFLGIENRYGLLKKGRTPGVNLVSSKSGKWNVKRLA